MSEFRNAITAMAYDKLSKISRERDRLRDENIRLRAELERARLANKNLTDDVLRLVK